MRFDSKTVIVTGSGAGIGRAAAIAYAKEGANVVVNSVTDNSGAETLKLIQNAGGEGIFVRGDVSKLDDVKKIVSTTLEHYSDIDILVNNAGIVLGGHPDDTTEDDWDAMMNVNVKGAFFMIREVIPYMLKKHHGSIVNISSVAAQKGLKNRYGYSATKGALIAMSKSIAAEYIEQGIRCNAICPGTILTPSLQYRIDSAPDPVAEKNNFFARSPIGRLGTPEEVAEAILFASDDAASFMTASVISINGGMIL